MNGLLGGYWCECWTQKPGMDQQPALHASFDAHTAAQADRWIAIALRTISPALDTAASEQAWEWLYEGRIDTRRALLRAEPCSVTVNQAGTHITWTARPVIFLPLAHHQGTELQACTYDFKPTRPTELQLSLLVQGSLRSLDRRPTALDDLRTGHSAQAHQRPLWPAHHRHHDPASGMEKINNS